MTSIRFTLVAWAAIALTANGVLAACGGEGGYNDTRGWDDAGIATRNDDKTHIVNNANGYPNVSIKCDGKYGYMVFTVTHSLTDVPPVVVPDPRCPGYRPDLITPKPVSGSGAPIPE